MTHWLDSLTTGQLAYLIFAGLVLIALLAQYVWEKIAK